MDIWKSKKAGFPCFLLLYEFLIGIKRSASTLPFRGMGQGTQREEVRGASTVVAGGFDVVMWRSVVDVVIS